MLSKLTKSSFAKPFIAAAIAVSPFLPFSFATADGSKIDPATATEVAYNNQSVRYYNSELKAAAAASEYARENNALGIAISYGPHERLPSPEHVGNMFVQEAKKHNEDAAYFIYVGGKPGISISYTNGFTSQGPMSGGEAAQNLSAAIAEKRRIRKELYEHE